MGWRERIHHPDATGDATGQHFIKTNLVMHGVMVMMVVMVALVCNYD